MRILYLGNSITKHMPAPEIGWHGEWGMAASAPEKDYVRRMNALLVQAGKRVEWRAENAADFERAPEPFPEEAFRAYLAFAPDVVILRIGENVPDDIAEPFGEAYEKLIRLLQSAGAAVFAVGSFWKKDGVENAMRAAAARTGVRFVSLEAVQAADYQAQGMFEHAGVAAHPGDGGMEAIARIIFNAVREEGLLDGASVVPVPSGEPKYGEISVVADGCPIGCYTARVSAMPFNRVWPGSQRPPDQTETAPFFSCVLYHPADLCVSTGEKVLDAVIRPLSKGVTPEIEGNNVYFTLREPGPYSVEINGRSRNLHIFADPARAPQPDPEKVTYRFPAGVHKLQSRIVLKSGESVYLAPGAVVYGELESTDAQNVAVFGGGILDGSLVRRSDADGCDVRRDGLIHFTRCRNVLMDGVILRDPALWTVTSVNCENVQFHNVKLIGMWRYNSDGFDFVNCRNVHVSDCFLRTFDDSVVIKGLYFGDPAHRETEAMNNENYLVERCVVWCDWGGALEVGAETVADAYNNLVYRDCDVIRNDSGAMRLHCGDRAFVRNVLYEDIRVEYSKYDRRAVYQHSDDMAYAPPPEPNSGEIAKVWQYCGIWSPDNILGNVRDVTYRNIRIYADPEVPEPCFRFNGADADHCIAGVTIGDVYYNGKPLVPHVEKNAFVDIRVTGVSGGDAAGDRESEAGADI
ncbi:MAG: hypothetical protein IJJ85_07400 [Clostridia bacterium]|nr:hypothetical protein [Clostridia bacterium]